MKFLEGLGAFFAFLASLVSGVISSGKSAVTTPPKLKAASIYLSSETTFPTLGGTLPIDIKLNADGLTLSAAAVRVVYKYIGTLPLLPQDADSFKEGIQAKENFSLLEQGWVFPVNEIILDTESRLIMVDFAAVNLNPEGYASTKDVTLATIDLWVTSLAPKLTFNFDKDRTKVISKEGNEVKLELKPGEFAVR